MADPVSEKENLIPEKLTRWSLDRVQYLLSHIEGFIEDENKELRERARSFVVSTDLDTIESLVTIDPMDSRLPPLILNALNPFFESGFLLQRGPTEGISHWWVTDIFCRGNSFHLDLADQVMATKIVPEMTPLQVHRTPAEPLLARLNLLFLLPGPHAEAFLLRPTPTVAYLLITNLAAPWSNEHLRQTQRLINKCFLF
jgi:hypothetical protein